MPALGYILYESRDNVQTLTKTNLSSYCRYLVSTTEQPDAKVLLEERIIAALAANENSNSLVKEEIEFSYDGKIVSMTDGKFKQSFEPSSAEDYPVFPLNEEDVIKTALTEDMLVSIGIAANYVDDKRKTNFSFVHINDDVFATDNFSMYYKAFPGTINAVLNKEAAQIASGLPGASYYGNTHIDFFESGAITYGFVRSELDNKPPYMKIVSKLDKSNSMTITKQDLERFCQMTRTIHDSNDEPVSTMENTGMFLTLNYRHDGLNKSNRVEIAAENMQQFEPFRFNPGAILVALQALPYPEIDLSINGVHCVVSTKQDTNYVGLLTGVSQKQNQ